MILSVAAGRLIQTCYRDNIMIPATGTSHSDAARSAAVTAALPRVGISACGPLEYKSVAHHKRRSNRNWM